jgi:uncharacterized protein YjbI with pentapeptide repeats
VFRKLFVLALIFSYVLPRLPRPIRQHRVKSACSAGICKQSKFDNLSNMSFRYLDLTGYKFNDMTIKNFTFNETTFSGCQFTSATFNNSTFNGSTFKDTVFVGSHFESTSFENSTIDGTKFHMSEFEDVSFRNTILGDGVEFAGSTGVDLSGAKIEGKITLPDGTALEPDDIPGCSGSCYIFKFNDEYYNKAGLEKVLTSNSSKIIRLTDSSKGLDELTNGYLQNMSRAFVDVPLDFTKIESYLSGVGLDVGDLYDFIGVSKQEGIGMSSEEIMEKVKTKISELRDEHGESHESINFNDLEKEFEKVLGTEKSKQKYDRDLTNGDIENNSTVREDYLRKFRKSIDEDVLDYSKISTDLSSSGVPVDNAYEFIGLTDEEGSKLSGAEVQNRIKVKINELKIQIENGEIEGCSYDVESGVYDYHGLNLDWVGRQLGFLFGDEDSKEDYDNYIQKSKGNVDTGVSSNQNVDPEELIGENIKIMNMLSEYTDLEDNPSDGLGGLVDGNANNGSGGFAPAVENLPQLENHIKKIIATSSSVGDPIGGLNSAMKSWIQDQQSNGSYNEGDYTTVKFNNEEKYYNPNGDLVDYIPIGESSNEISIDSDYPVESTEPIDPVSIDPAAAG